MTCSQPVGLIFLVLALGACGDGTASPPAPPPSPPANAVPVFTSPAQASVPENTAGPVYTVAAADAPGDTISFALSGTDAGDFAFSPADRTLTPAGPLDFEVPADANGDNVYEVTFTATDPLGASASLGVSITVTNVAEALSAVRIVSGAGSLVQVVPVPGSERLLLVEQGGLVRDFDLATGTTAPVPFLDIRGEVSTGGEQGLLGLALSPQFAGDRTFYVNLTNVGGDSEIRRYRTFPGATVQADPATEDLILTFAQPFANHNAGWLGFANDGLLLVPTGDGGSGGDPQGNAQNRNSLLGKVLRLDMTRDDFPADPDRDYGIPPGNPFAAGGGAPEILAIGLRNPFRASIDEATGELYIGDVGQNAIEEIDRFLPGSTLVDFGWNRREGAQAFGGGASLPGDAEPVIDYAHGSGPFEGNSVLGGLVYRGPVAALDGRFVFGDTVSGNVWSAPVTSLRDGTTLRAGAGLTRLTEDIVPDAGTIGLITSFAVAPDGRLLISDLQGEVFAIGNAP